jgi:hypothetical protein
MLARSIPVRINRSNAINKAGVSTREPPYPAFRRVNPLKQIVERKSPLRWYDKFTVENIIALGKSIGGGSDFRKVPTKILPRLGPHCRRILIAAQKATEAIPFWFILPVAAAGISLTARASIASGRDIGRLVSFLIKGCSNLPLMRQAG